MSQVLGVTLPLPVLLALVVLLLVSLAVALVATALHRPARAVNAPPGIAIADDTGRG